MILTIIFILLILTIHLPKSKIHCPSLIQIISVIVPMMSTILFIPIFETLISIFICNKGYNEYGKELKCWENVYVFHSVISVITLVIFILYSFLIQNTFFELKYNKNGYSSKKTLLTDNILLYNKMIIIIGIKFFYASHSTQIIMAFIVICMAYLSYCYTSITPYYFFEVQRSYMIMSYITTWTFLILLVSQLTINTNFNGNLALLIIGNVVICIGILLSDKRINFFLILKCSLHLSSGDEAINQIEELFSIIHPKENDRISPLIFFGYVNQYSSNSIKENDPLAKYIQENDKNNLMHIMIHMHSLYLTALSKFPEDVRLRIFYAIFMFDGLSKREQALRELDIAQSHNPIFSFEFIIYRLKNVFENQICNGNINTFSTEMSELSITLTYKKLYSEFKLMISKAANDYILFWNILSISNESNKEDLSKLNSIGSKIKNSLEKINKLYFKMIKIKPYNQEIILGYAFFNTYILNDEKKSKIFNHQLKEISHLNSVIEENNLCHLDLNTLYSVNDYYYIIFSAMIKNIGIITHISIPVCSLFGYTKEELIGYPVQKLLPDIYSKSHQKSLLKIAYVYKKKIFEEINMNHSFKANFIVTNTYAVTKSKYLIPFHYKGAFFPNDNGNNYFFMKILIDTSSTAISHSQNICYVLTDKHLVIQHFTSNATSLLGLNSDTFHSSKEITSHIKQLHEDYINHLIKDEDNGQDDSDQSRLELKSKLIKSKYSAYAPITWVSSNGKSFRKENNNLNSQKLFNGDDEYKGGAGVSPTTSSIHKIKVNNYEDNFMLIVNDYGDFGEKEGFIFRFEPLWYFHFKANSRAISNKDLIKSVKTKKLLLEEDLYTIMSRMRVGSKESSYSHTQIKISKGFLPEITQKFQYNPNQNSFDKTNLNEPNKYHYQLKEKAENKWNQLKKTNNEQSSCVNNSEEDSSPLSSSVSNSDNYTQSSQKKSITKKVSESTSEDDYYHVDMSKIKYSIYNYTKGVVIEKTEFNKISEVEYKLYKETIEEKKQEAGLSAEDGNTNKGTTPINYQQPTIQTDKLNRRKQMIKKEIKKAFKKGTVQSTILVLYILSLITFILTILKESALLFHYLLFMDMIQNYIALIRISYKINRNALHSIYSLRELILVNVDSYVIPFEEYTKEEYINMHLRNLEMLYQDTDDVLTKIMINPIQIPPDNLTILNNEAGYTFFLRQYDNYSIGNNSNTFRAACHVVNSALGNIVHTSPSKYYPTNEDIFLFMFTTLNTLWVGLLEQNEIYKLFFNDLIEDLFVKQIILFFCLELVMGISYITSRVGLKGVSDKNNSYLSVYYAINKDIITILLAKCEKFIFQFQTNTIQDRFHDEISEKENDDNNQKEEELIIISNPNHNKEMPSLHIGQKSCREKFKCLNQFFIGYLIILYGSIIVLVFDGLLLGKMFEIENRISYAITVYQGEASIEKDTILIFDLLRESVFDRNSLFLLYPLKNNIGKLITDIYNSIQIEKQKAENSIQFVSTLYNHYYSTNYKNICDMKMNQDKCIEYTSRSALYVSIH